jgi:hypothetical protein
MAALPERRLAPDVSFRLHDRYPLFKGHGALSEQSCLLAGDMDLASNVVVSLIAPRAAPDPKLGNGFAIVLDRRKVVLSARNHYCLELSSDGLGVIFCHPSYAPGRVRV